MTDYNQKLKGFVNIIKPVGMTSSNVVVKVRGILRKATGEKQKVGHLGTLDPYASGVLPIAVGTATRLFDLALQKKKTYIAEFTFGKQTDTLDSEGEFVLENDFIPSQKQVLSILPKFIGKINQLPPVYSAKSINGNRAYKLAREGKLDELENSMKTKQIEIFSLSAKQTSSKFQINDTFTVDIECGSGTYIRSLARDFGLACNTVCYMSSLNRTNSGEFNIENGITIEEFEKNPLTYLLPVETMLSKFEKYELPENIAFKVLNGVKLKAKTPKDIFSVYYKNEPIAIGKNTNGILTLTTRL